MDMNIGERIKYFRSTKGYTVNKLANLSGISQSYLRDIELGKNSNPSLEVLDCLCGALGITLKDFFNDSLQAELCDDPIVNKIYQLSKKQRDALLAFLDSMKEE